MDGGSRKSASRSKPMSEVVTRHEAAHAEHPHLAFWRKYIFSTDHKTIGIQYGLTSLCFLLFGFTLIMVRRWQLAYPDVNTRPAWLQLGWLAKLLGETRFNLMSGKAIMLPEFYNQLGAMHGTIMVFLGVVPLAVGAF